MNKITEKLIKLVVDNSTSFQGAFNIRENGLCSSQQSTKNISIVSKKNNTGLDITVKDNTKHETVCIPAIVTEGGIDDRVYNDFVIGDNCDIVIISGCGVHTDTAGEAIHDGIHTFRIGKNSHVKYIEKHVGTGSGTGTKAINPKAEIILDENAFLEMETTQISGVTLAKRYTHATVGKNAKLTVQERLYTQGKEHVDTDFLVDLKEEGSKADIVSRSVARDHSYQNFVSTIVGHSACKGHSECDSIIDEEAIVDSTPRLVAKCKEASLIHEAAIGKIAGEQILKLQTLGLSEEQAENQIIDGFLS